MIYPSTKHWESEMKLIDLLVQELPKRGGWPEGALNATQDKDGEVGFSAGAVPEFCYDAWDGGDWCGNEFHTIRASDYATAIVTREQYESALAASKAVVGHDGWIQWAGGECPVDSDAIVEVKCRWHNQHQYNNDRAGDFYWSHTGSNADIIAYRLQQPTKSEQVRADAAETDDEADLNECIGQGVDMPEWNGDGLPPVGIKCEHCPGGTTQHEWEVVTVAGVHENTSTGFIDYWLVRENGSSYIVGNPYRFRPLRTEAEKAREAAIQRIVSVINYRNGCSPKPLAGWLYDAISAGKIPGVKLEEK